MLSAITGYQPPSQFLFDQSGYLTAPSAGTPLEIATSYIDSHASDLGLSDGDLASPFVTDMYTDADTRLAHIYLRQQVNGLEVDSANFTISVDSRGEVLSVGGGFVAGLSELLGNGGSAVVPEISPAMR